MEKSEVKNKAQNLYYKLRKEGVSHALALAAVVDLVLASLPAPVPPTEADMFYKNNQ